eukprot:gene10033-12884_t
MNAFCQIDVQKSEAQCPSDKQKIFDAVQHHDGGFRGVNLLVNNAIREWLLASARTALSRLQMKPPVNSALKEQKDDHIRAVIYLKCNVARLLNELGHYDGAEELLRSAHSDSAGVFPETHTTVYCILSTLSTVYTQQGKYQEAEELSTRAMRGLALDPEQREHYLSTTNNLAASLDKQGKRSEAEALYRKILDEARGLCVKSTVVCGVENNLAALLADRGELNEALVHYKTAAEGYERFYGPEHPCTLGTMSNIASLLGRSNRYAEAEEVFVKVLAGQEKALGEDHPDVLGSLNNLGTLASAQGKDQESERYFQRSYQGQLRVLGPEHPDTVSSAFNLAMGLCRQRRANEAEPLLRTVLANFRKTQGPDSAQTVSASRALAQALTVQQKFEEALGLYAEELTRLRDTQAEDHPTLTRCMMDTAIVHQRLGHVTEAEQLYRAVYERRLKASGPHHVDTARVAYNLATLLAGAQRQEYKQAAEFFLASYEGLKAVLGEQHPETQDSLKLWER